MDLVLTRRTFTEHSTIGDLTRDGERLCVVLEDCDRGLEQGWNREQIARAKLPGRTAIPSGRYLVVVTWSPRFQRPLPLLLDVPGYEGVRVHPGNTEHDTEGCLLPGLLEGPDRVDRSRDAFGLLYPLISAACSKGERVVLTIGRNAPPATNRTDGAP